ncbi:GFA family protein [Paraferrimonas sedimenticola]|uniref:Aldehyde-activating protein n=1 Tax=Paraferrimonas sedimenticola TaxID=375674 RepID=A0AA37RU77_9GAMM|nr:GFA family protein [Paraferrimonas sedimenticola]GLP95870.1 aldehyde-activating protein [Paraferrimonas sedimenticola]
MNSRTAACSCGQLQLSASDEPVRVSVCHCTACQRRTGSAFGIQARFDSRVISLKGESKSYRRQGDSGQWAEFHFCPDCGATVYYYLQGLEGFMGVPVGAFADPQFPSPQLSIYQNRAHCWLTLDPSIERLE